MKLFPTSHPIFLRAPVSISLPDIPITPAAYIPRAESAYSTLTPSDSVPRYVHHDWQTSLADTIPVRFVAMIR